MPSGTRARRWLAAVGAIVLLVASIGPARGQRLPGASDESMAALARGEWPTYAGTYASAKYSPLDQITAANVKDLEIAWRWTSPDHAVRDATRTIDPGWHYQIVRHGLWDYDLPAAPNLMDVTIDGRRVKAVAQVTKQGFVFAFDRVTGTPLWPIENRPVPQSRVPGEKTEATQPFPTKPPPFEIQGVREEDLIDFTPELRAQAMAIIGRYDHGPLYTPPTERGAIAMPGVTGGASWSGAAWDPESATYYVPTVRLPFVLTLHRPSFGVGSYVGRAQYLAGPQGLPLFKPPWGGVVAIDMSRGEHRWRAPVGAGYPAHPARPAVPDRLGWPARSFTLVTKSLLLVVQSGYLSNPRAAPFAPERRIWDLTNREPKLYAYDKATGRLLAEVSLPANASGAPMTYLAGGKQYVAFPVGGANLPEELIALRLP